jgi:hypothetical protein
MVFRWGPASLPAVLMTGTEADRHQQRSPDCYRWSMNTRPNLGNAALGHTKKDARVGYALKLSCDKAGT